MRALWLALGLLVAPPAGASADAPDDEVIRLAPEPSAATGAGGEFEMSQGRHGFDYGAFVSRLETLWFQRKTLLASGREEDAQDQLEQIRSFCAAEGVKRLEHLAGALVAEAHRYHGEGNDAQALSVLEFAEAFDPHRPQVHIARATVLWRSGGGAPAAGRALWRALEASAVQSVKQLSLLPRLAFVLGLSVVGAALTFGLVVLLRYQAPLRHEIEERCGRRGTPWPQLAGWSALALPLLTWFAAGWSVLAWMVACFRFMTRQEKLATLAFLLLGALTVPAHGIAVGLYGTAADPAVRTTVASVDGEYDPDHILRLRQLVEAHPHDPSYHFLLAGLYKNGGYFEEAFEEYRAVLQIAPDFTPALINIGNIFYATGQYGPAIKSFRQALEGQPGSLLAHYNLHLAQSENFHFAEAEQSLERAREIDAGWVTDRLARSGSYDEPAGVQDAGLRMASVWEAAVGGRSPSAVREAGAGGVFLPPGSVLNTFTILCLVGVVVCLASAAGCGAPARRCIRCGRSFCEKCKSESEAHEYCGQCLHLYVLRDGLEPETKARKLYEVRRHEQRSRRLRLLLVLLLPGAGQLFRGKTWRGMLLLVAWFGLLIVAVPELLPPPDGGGLQLSTDLLLAADVPMRFDVHASRYVAAALLPLAWVVGAWPLRRRAEV